jgi:predicted dehydrogenase
MKPTLIGALLCAAAAWAQPSRLIVLDPGHFHATLLQKEMYPELAPRVSVYAPLGPELLDYLNRIYLFNTRKDNPTRWEVDVRCSADPVQAMLRDRPGDIVVLTGRNRPKIDRIAAAASAGLHVLADKPWIISADDFPKLQQALDTAESRKVTAYDIMTERYEVTSELQREFVNDREVFGTLRAGDQRNPGVRARSVHNIMKNVAGVPLRRPVFFFDTREQGEALADVGTHVVDLVQWTAFPNQAIDYRKDIKVYGARRWPIVMTRAQFQQVTGQPEFPAALASHVQNGRFEYHCNNSGQDALRGIHVQVEIAWEWEAVPGTGDSYEASFQGTRARIDVRQGKAENHIPQVYIVPADAAARPAVLTAVRKKVASVQQRWPGLEAEEAGGEIRLRIPDKLRVGHEAHFAQVARRFLEYIKSPGSMPAWEKPNMLAKYYVCTMGVKPGRNPR